MSNPLHRLNGLDMLIPVWERKIEQVQQELANMEAERDAITKHLTDDLTVAFAPPQQGTG